MNDQMLNEGFWPGQFKAWLQLAFWLEWMQPFLYCLLAIAVVSLVLVLLDLAMLCSKEFPSEAKRKKKTPANKQAARVSEAENVPSAARKLLSHL